MPIRPVHKPVTLSFGGNFALLPKTSEDSAVVTESSHVEMRSAAEHLAVEGYALGVAGVAYAVTYNVSGDNVWVAVGLTGVAYGLARWQTRNL